MTSPDDLTNAIVAAQRQIDAERWRRLKRVALWVAVAAAVLLVLYIAGVMIDDHAHGRGRPLSGG